MGSSINLTKVRVKGDLDNDLPPIKPGGNTISVNYFNNATIFTALFAASLLFFLTPSSEPWVLKSVYDFSEEVIRGENKNSHEEEQKELWILNHYIDISIDDNLITFKSDHPEKSFLMVTKSGHEYHTKLEENSGLINLDDVFKEINYSGEESLTIKLFSKGERIYEGQLIKE